MNLPLVTMCDSFDVHLERFLTIFDYQFAIFFSFVFCLRQSFTVVKNVQKNHSDRSPRILLFMRTHAFGSNICSFAECIRSVCSSILLANSSYSIVKTMMHIV